jgi:hypothetical protein
MRMTEQNAKGQVLGETYEAGKPTEADAWRRKMRNREEMLRYIKSSERYWVLDHEQWYGSEKRKSKA